MQRSDHMSTAVAVKCSSLGVLAMCIVPSSLPAFNTTHRGNHTDMRASISNVETADGFWN